MATHTQVFTVSNIALPANGAVILPDPGGSQFKVPNQASVVEAFLNLSDTDKLSVGLVIQFSTFFSVDRVVWTFGNGFTWVSYGPSGLTVRDPDGTVHINPDPRLQIGVSNHRGDFIRVSILSSQAINAGATVNVF